VAGLMKTSRIPISVIDDQLIVDAARDAGRKIDDLVVRRSDGDVVLQRDGIGGLVLNEAIAKWWGGFFLWQRIPFVMQHQQQTQWCWAAVSVSVSHYYSPWSGWTQCAMVNAELGQTTCCIDGASAQCNQPNVLDSPLQRAGVLDHMTSTDAGIGDIRNEIDAGRPLCWRIGWKGGGGHFAVIEGYRMFPDVWVAVDDPWYGASDLPLDVLTTGGYQGSGDWTHTYFTKRPPFFFPFLYPKKEIRIPDPAFDRIREHAKQLGGGDR
jgi:papain like cysteine protease AvrRpt2